MQAFKIGLLQLFDRFCSLDPVRKISSQTDDRFRMLFYEFHGAGEELLIKFVQFPLNGGFVRNIGAGVANVPQNINEPPRFCMVLLCALARILNHVNCLFDIHLLFR